MVEEYEKKNKKRKELRAAAEWIGGVDGTSEVCVSSSCLRQT